MAEICVLGLGYVGLPTASLLATAGYKVVGVDTNPAILAALKEHRTNLKEVGLNTLVTAACRSGNLTAAEVPEPAQTYIICVPTPVDGDHRVCLAAVEQAARAVGRILRPDNLVILESTSPVGTTRNVIGRILGEYGLKPGKNFSLCYCPERVLPGNTLAELVNNDRVIGGYTPACAEKAYAIYSRFCHGRITLTDDRTAELCKLMENTFRDVNIALANSFAQMAERSEIDVWKAIECANLHPRVQILKPGPGVGGHCIPVDPWFLVESFPENSALLRAARQINEGQTQHILDRLMATGRVKPGDKLGILGAVYKAGIDDVRHSPGLQLAKIAREAGLRIAVHDPLAGPSNCEGVKISDDLPQCLAGVQAVVLTTEHQCYRTLTARDFSREMKGRLIFDARNWLDHGDLRRAGFDVMVTGIGVAEPLGVADEQEMRIHQTSRRSNRAASLDAVQAD